MNVDISAEFDSLKKEIRAYWEVLQKDVKEIKNSVSSNAGQHQTEENSFAANQRAVAATPFPFGSLAKGKGLEETGIAQLLHHSNDNTSTTPQPTEKFVPKGLVSIRKHYDLCLLFSPTGCSVANALTAELTNATENNIKLANFLSPPLVSQDVALYIENSIAKASVVALVLSKGALNDAGLIFAAECALLYSSPIVLIHDQSQGLFPGEDEQPNSLKDAGIFNDKAITFSASYAEACARELLKKLEKVGAKTDMGVLINNSNLVQQALQKVQHSFLALPNSGIPLEEVLHGMSHYQALTVFFTYELLENKNWVTSILEAAVIAGVRIYIVYDPNDQTVLPFARHDFPKLGIASKVFEMSGTFELTLRQVIAAEKAAGGCQRKVEDVRTRGFLSHKRSSAQGIAGRIFQALRNDYKIFLDSEADFELHDLEEIVKQTELFIFILSEGIFDSFWCLQELKSAIACRKKVVLLRDVKFTLPKKWADDQQDIADIIKNNPMIDYIPEFFNDCVRQLKKFLGPTEAEIQTMLNCKEVKKMEHKPEATSFVFSEVPEGMTFPFFLETGYYSTSFMDFVKKLDTVELVKFPFDMHTAQLLMNYFTDLKFLRLSGQQEIEDAAISLISTKLTSIRITNTAVSAASFGGIKPENSSIKRLSLENCTKIGGDVFELVLSKFPQLVELEVCGCGIEDKQIIFNQKWNNLKSLSLRASLKLGAEGFQTILSAFPELEQVSLSLCPVNDAWLKDLKTKVPRLKEIDLFFCDVSASVMEELDAQGIHASGSDASLEARISGPCEYSSYVSYPSYEDAGIFSFHTDVEDKPWWKMSLPHDCAISRMVLRNRTDGCQERICPAEVYILNSNEEVVKTLQIKDIQSVYKFDNVNAIGRYIKVQLLKKNALHFAEMQVYHLPMDPDAEFIFSGKGEVTMSSYLRYADHERRGCFSFHTDEEDNPWWKKVLEKNLFITKLVLNNRTDCCQERIAGALLEILDENDQVVKTFTCEGVEAKYVFEDIGVTGRGFKVRLERWGILHFTTLDVYYKIPKKSRVETANSNSS